MILCIDVYHVCQMHSHSDGQLCQGNLWCTQPLLLCICTICARPIKLHILWSTWRPCLPACGCRHLVIAHLLANGIMGQSHVRVPCCRIACTSMRPCRWAAAPPVQQRDRMTLFVSPVFRLCFLWAILLLLSSRAMQAAW